MATKELVGKRGKPEDIQNQAMTMALAILMDRIGNLPKDDRDDLYELMKEIPNAETPAEWEEIAVGMQEILDQDQVQLTALTCEEKNGNGLQSWLDFVKSRIRQFREAAGMTQMELAQKSGLPQSHISRLEAGKHSPSRVTLEKIAKALSVDMKELDPTE